jgi:hypothetical protein
MYRDQWWSLYRDAVLETDNRKIHERIKAAEEAIEAFLSLGKQLTGEERLALEESRNGLETLKRERGTSQSDWDQ